MRDELWALIQTWEETGYLPNSWRHREPGTAFSALGPPRSTVRVYYAGHHGQIVLLHVAQGKSGRGKLEQKTKDLVEKRLAKWKAWFPEGAEIDDSGQLRRRAKGGKR